MLFMFWKSATVLVCSSVRQFFKFLYDPVLNLINDEDEADPTTVGLRNPNRLEFLTGQRLSTWQHFSKLQHLRNEFCNNNNKIVLFFFLFLDTKICFNTKMFFKRFAYFRCFPIEQFKSIEVKVGIFIPNTHIDTTFNYI